MAEVQELEQDGLGELEAVEEQISQSKVVPAAPVEEDDLPHQF